MSETYLQSWRSFMEGTGPGLAPETEHSEHAMAALERHKREGMLLAVRARWVALAIIGVMLPFLNFDIETLFPMSLLALLALNGWLQVRVARVGRSRAEVALIFLDLAILAAAIALPNPLDDDGLPLAVQLRYQGHMYFFVLLAFGTLAYSWRTVRGYGGMTTMVWAATVTLVWYFADQQPELTAALEAAFPDDPDLVALLDPGSVLWWIRVQEIVLFFIVAFILSMSVRRFGDLLLTHAAVERERTNLARYFSPNVVEELSQNDEPLKKVRTQDVAVLFVDIVGFTPYAAGREPEEVIQTLRAFHQRMEAEVFRHNGTLDKYLGDGLMATFGTPVAGEEDALNAFRCAKAMAASVADWNADRKLKGEPPIRASFGLHFGPAVLGDVGANRLEFAVIGNTVNVASRVEALTRKLDVEIAVTEEMRAEICEEGGSSELTDFAAFPDQEIRGLEERATIWGRA